MNIALMAVFVIVSIIAVLFIVSRYRVATAAQRSQIIFGAAGAIVVAAAVFWLFGFR